jgi:flagellar hook-basal body complex protein FliE
MPSATPREKFADDAQYIARMRPLWMMVLCTAVTLSVAGCGDSSEQSDSANENETQTETTASETETETETDEGTLASDDFSALNSSDDRVQDGVTAFQASLTSCTTTGVEAQIRACFSRKYRQYGRVLSRHLDAINEAQDAADGDCGDLLEEAEDSTRELQRVSETLKTAFADARYDDVDVDAFGTGFNGYRDDMDEALEGCA